MAFPNLTTRSVVLPNGHGRTVGVAALIDKTDLAATFTGDALDLGGPVGAMTLTVTPTAQAGTTPTLDVIVEHSHDGSTWATLGSMTQITTSLTAETKTFGPSRRYIRGKATLGGTTPVYSFTFGGDLDLSFI